MMKTSHGKLDRRTVEKNRRMHMKNLFFQLQALIPKPDCSCKDMTLYNVLDEARKCIQDLKQRIERMKKTKEFNDVSDYDKLDNTVGLGFELPVISVRNHDKILEVLLISGVDKRFHFHEVIRILEEEGSEVLNASFSIVDDKIFYLIHSQAISCGIGLDASMVYQRLHQLIA